MMSWLSQPLYPEIIRPLLTREELREDDLRAYEESRKQIKKCGVFDIKGSLWGLEREVPRPWRPCPYLVMAYAKLGLHRYNLLKKDNLQFSRVRYYVRTTPVCAGTYYITLDAMDPTSRSSRTLQTSVSELSLGKLTLVCDIARIRGENDAIGYSGPSSKYRRNPMPEWPPENPFENSKRAVKEVEDWMRLYLDLAVAIDHSCGTSNRVYDSSKVKILKVAMATEDVNEGPDADSVIVLYIRYKDLRENRIGKDVDRVAIIRRRFNEVTGWFSLEGKTLSSQIVMPKKKKKQSPRRRLRLGIHKPWRLSYPRPRMVCKAYKNRVVGVGLARRPFENVVQDN